MASKKRKKKRHYKTGIHKSKKCFNSPMKYRSGWELTVAKHLDDNPDVVLYAYEFIKIPYISNKRYGKVRSYIPDFLIEYSDGKVELVEVKRTSALNQSKVKKKAEAAKRWAEKNGAEFKFWTETTIKQFQKIQEAKKKKSE